MYRMHTLLLSTLLGGILCAPLFVFAQTSTSTSTTTAEQSTQADIILQEQIRQINESRLNLLSKIENATPNAIQDLLDVKVSPKNPGPNEQVNVKIESYLSDMNKAMIIWSLNGRVTLKGTGKTSFSFQNGDSGETTRLSVSVLTNSGEKINKDLSWTPVGVTIFWEADTYTPPFYRGKPLLSPQARVKVVATPNSVVSQNALGHGNLVYIWEKGGSPVPEASGYGKNSFLFVGPKPYDDTNVRVRVSSVDDTIISEARVYLSVSNPFILFYDKHPLLGVLYNQPMGTLVNLTNKEISLSSEPYFFSNERGETASIKYLWSINGSTVQNSGRTITLRNDTETKGSSVVSLSMRGTKQSFQTASRSVVVNFTELPTTNRPIF